MSDEPTDRGDSDPPDQTEATNANTKTVRHDWTQSTHPSVVIVETVAAATNRPTTDLPPLQETLDVEALDTLFDGRQPTLTVTFRYANTTVTVHGTGSVTVRLDGPPERRAEE
jgi:hypothetical protein